LHEKEGRRRPADAAALVSINVSAKGEAERAAGANFGPLPASFVPAASANLTMPQQL
jgi:hypothetical protein